MTLPFSLRRITLASPFGRGAPVGGGEGVFTLSVTADTVPALPKGEPRAEDSSGQKIPRFRFAPLGMTNLIDLQNPIGEGL